jgi:hypothetical protein
MQHYRRALNSLLQSDLAQGTRQEPSAVKPAWLAAILVLVVCLLDASGCHSTDRPASASFASTTISGNTPGQIRDAAIVVFQQDGYKATRIDPNSLLFEKEGTKMNEIAYGSWLGDVPVWVRVKASVVPLGEMTFRLQCRAFMVRDRGTATEEEVTLSNLHKGSYQKLMDQVAQQLAKH